MTKYISACCLLILMLGCYKEPEFDLKPAIEFKEVKKWVLTDAFSNSKKDSVIISLKFQDGDGDLGVNDEERESQFKGNPNYNIRAFRQKNGKFSEITFVPSLSGFFPRLRTDTKTGPIEGTLDYSINFFQAFQPKKDTLKFEIFLKDRAANTSNTVESKIIVLNE